MQKLITRILAALAALGVLWLAAQETGWSLRSADPEPAARARDTSHTHGYLILALSWTPSWCAIEGAARGAERCAPGADTGWLVHGLWPQFDAGGWPEFCDTPHPGPTRAQTAAMIDIMGSDGLALHQWRKHGTCSGWTAQDYFDQTRAVFAQVTFPEPISPAGAGLHLSPEDLMAPFRAANPGLGPDEAILTCRDGMAQEIRLCVTHDLIPRPCDAGVLSRHCRARSVHLPPRP